MPAIVGIGSLLSKASAERSFPVYNFRKARLHGWKRIFNLVGVHSIRTGRANLETLEVAALAAAEDSNSSILVSLFEVPVDEMSQYYIREQRYVHRKVIVTEEDGSQTEAMICEQNTESQYLEVNCNGDKTIYNNIVGDVWKAPIWYNFPDGVPPNLDPPAVFPIRQYLRLCLSGAESLNIMDCFLDNTFVYDGRTLRKYLSDNPDIAEETAPHNVQESDNLKFGTRPHESSAVGAAYRPSSEEKPNEKQ
eukprot:TRINITY_DN8230_c0_g1_i1.p2 TRINITY_DN8230_c0_g1~~TRINITY_DN8230_c0_g1_i1.p2  ORF type:complete len:250 (+),score=47.90 TRINITY_DN8230_c0_g1_i1:52-801(+)